MKIKASDIAFTAIIAALYAVFTLICYPFSFLGIQFRLSEMMIILVFFNRRYSVGLVLGCFLANLASPLGLYDALFGTLATLLSVLTLCFIPYLAVGLLLTVSFNAFVVGAEIYFLLGEAFWLSTGLVAIGEATVLTIGYILTWILRKKTNFFKLVKANRNLNFKF